MIDLISGLIEIILGFFGLILNLFIYIFSTGEEKQRAKEDLKELSKSFLIPFVVVFGIAGIFFVQMINDIDNKPISSMRDDGDPLGCAHYGGEWDTGGLFGEAKCVYNKTDESDNK
ncbi:hypothetical protein [Bacillus toyonensis]|uniref:hypothetical protein n=1 Tax=Bacillus toyonensis TaxID=155322 RepID=UPI0015CF7514|nr:hypothetical protein [Bacillus toyonensis]MCU4969219.1 hypothetical protein [Bacillus toyonensis]WIG25001.1 hypothetical protein QPL81_01435 [Bacillus toyonensis]